MAKRPENTRLVNVFNPGVDKRIPLGFVDQVIDKETGLLVGFVKDGEFYNLGDKVKEKPKAKDTSPGEPEDIVNLIKLQESLLPLKQSGIRRYEEGSDQYLAAVKDIETTNNIIKELKLRLETAKVAKTVKKEQDTYKEEKGAYEAKVKAAKKSLQIAKDTGGDVNTAQAELDDILKVKPIAPSVSTGDVGMAGQPSGYRNVGTQKVGVTPTTPAPSTPTKDGTPSKGGAGGAGGKGGKGKEVPVLTDAEQRAQALDVAAGEDFALPETIFNNVSSLKQILNRYVKEDWTPEKLRKAIRDDVWFRKNSAEIKARYVQLYNYRDLVATGQADGSTDYEKQISTLERQIADKARQMGSGIASDPAALRKAAENMYITNVGIDDAMTTDFIAAAIRPIGSTIAGQGTTGYSGQALKDYQAIQDIARSNGFSVKDIVPGGQSEQQVLQGIATGKIDPNRLAQDARKLAAQGQPQYVRDLLGQGYNLDQVYAPYRQTMANLLEINPDQIDINDPTLRTAITDKGDMNVYDFKRTLKADKRWQYTENAKQEVSDAALKVLRDFGFQG
jgi:hypothetical protein